jgi:hypothetical protein
LALFGIVAMLKAPEPMTNVMFALINSGAVIRLATAVVIVLAVFGLRLLDKVSAEAAVATLSGIAGYLLGGQIENRRSPTVTPPNDA